MASSPQAPDGETMAEFKERRDREQADRALAKAKAHEDYGRDIRAQQAILAAPAANPPLQPTALTGNQEQHLGHPGFWESAIPIWGSGREALADLEDHDYAGAALNSALAVSDLFLAGTFGRAVAKGGLYAITGAIGKEASQANWKRAVRPELGRLGLLEKYQHGHHWFIPQSEEKVPAAIKNHPLNIMPMPSPEVHGRIHGRFKGKPQFDELERYLHGTPTWSKVASGSVAGHLVGQAKAEADAGPGSAEPNGQ